MSGNTFGKLFTITTAGESHGQALIGIVDGCPAYLDLSEEDLQVDLDRRRPGQSKYTTQRKEEDKVRILSGVYAGKTLGTPIGLLLENTDQKSRDYDNLRDRVRPGHADYTYHHKYGIYDHRGGGRASARETALRVAAGAIAKKYLKQYHQIVIQGYLSQMGTIKLHPIDMGHVAKSSFFNPDPDKENDLAELIQTLRKDRDSIGAAVTVITNPIPVGVGEPVYDKLDALLAHALMSINAVKAVSIGDGFAVVTQRGSEHVDCITEQGFTSNHAGGVLGGISSGQAIVAHIALKPTPSIPQAITSVTTSGENCEVVTTGRHDPCVGIRAVPVAEAMLALVLMDLILQARI